MQGLISTIIWLNNFFKKQKKAKKCFIFVSVPCFRSLFFLGLGVQLERFFFYLFTPRKKKFFLRTLFRPGLGYTLGYVCWAQFFFGCCVYCIEIASSQPIVVNCWCALAACSLVFFFRSHILYAMLKSLAMWYFFCWVQSWSLNVNLKLLK